MKRRALLTFFLILNGALFSAWASAAGDAEAGGKLFNKTCGGCHSIGENARNGFGPQLNGVIGQLAGTVPGYQFSDAMKNSGGCGRAVCRRGCVRRRPRASATEGRDLHRSGWRGP